MAVGWAGNVKAMVIQIYNLVLRDLIASHMQTTRVALDGSTSWRSTQCRHTTPSNPIQSMAFINPMAEHLCRRNASVGLGYLTEIKSKRVSSVCCRRWRTTRSPPHANPARLRHFAPLNSSVLHMRASICTCLFTASKLSFSPRRYVLPTTADRFLVVSFHVH